MENITLPKKKKYSAVAAKLHEAKVLLIARLYDAGGTQKGFCKYLEENGITPSNTKDISSQFVNDGAKMTDKILIALKRYVLQVENDKAVALQAVLTEIENLE